MRSLTWIVMIVALVALVGTPVLAQNARSSAMGSVGVGLADDSQAFGDNPAGLPFINPFGMSESEWPSMASGVASVDADWDRYGIFYSTRNIDYTQGWGAGYWHSEMGAAESDTYGGGFGMPISDAGFSAGVAVIHQDQSFGVGQAAADLENTFIDIGLMYIRLDDDSNVWRVGAVARDITEEMAFSSWYDIGGSIMMPNGLIVGVDVLDVTEEVDSTVNVGAELPLQGTAFLVRAGRCAVRVRYADNEASEHAAPLPQPSNLDALLYRMARRLLHQGLERRVRVRELSVCFAALERIAPSPK